MSILIHEVFGQDSDGGMQEVTDEEKGEEEEEEEEDDEEDYYDDSFPSMTVPSQNVWIGLTLLINDVSELRTKTMVHYLITAGLFTVTRIFFFGKRRSEL